MPSFRITQKANGYRSIIVTGKNLDEVEDTLYSGSYDFDEWEWETQDETITELKTPKGNEDI